METNFFEVENQNYLEQCKYTFYIADLCASGEGFNALLDGAFFELLFEDKFEERDWWEMSSVSKKIKFSKNMYAPYFLIEKVIDAKAPSFNEMTLQKIYNEIKRDERKLELVNIKNAVTLIKKKPTLILDYLKRRIDTVYGLNYRIILRLFLSLLLTRNLKKVDQKIAFKLFELLGLCEISNFGAHPLINEELDSWLNSRKIKEFVGEKIRLQNLRFYDRISGIYKPQRKQVTSMHSKAWCKNLGKKTCLDIVSFISEEQQLSLLKQVNQDVALAALRKLDNDTIYTKMERFRNRGVKRLESILKSNTGFLSSEVGSSIELLGYLSDKNSLCVKKPNFQQVFLNKKEVLSFLNAGIPLNKILGVRSLKMLCKLLIGTQHKYEVECLALLGAGLYQFSQELKALNTNRKNKVNRVGYLNDIYFIVDAFTYKPEIAKSLLNISTVRLKETIDLICNSSLKNGYLLTPSEERADTISMLLCRPRAVVANIIRFYADNIETTVTLHDYLVRIDNSIELKDEVNINFTASDRFESAKEKLADENISLIGNSLELKITGIELRNCIGSKSYISRGERGDVYLRYKNEDSDSKRGKRSGFVAHISSKLDKIYEVKGFANRSICDIERSILEKAMVVLRG